MIRGLVKNQKPLASCSKTMRADIHNRFEIEVIDSNTGAIKQRAFAENTVCNSLWGYLCGTKAWNNYIHYGTGSGTPSSSDTALFAFLGSGQSESYSTEYDHENTVYSYTKKLVLSESTAVGETLTEVGIAFGSSSSTLLTHAMLKDMNNNPISILKTDTDVINIYATVFAHFNLQEGLVFQGCLKNLSSTLLSHSVGMGNLDSLYCIPGVGYLPSSPRDMGSYSPMSVTHDSSNRRSVFSMTRLAVDAWNFTKGIKSIFITRWLNGGGASEVAAYVEEDSSWYQKSTILGESIGTGDGETKDFATDFGFVKNLTVYVDGVVVDSSVDSGSGFELGTYLKLLRMPSHAYLYNTSYLYRAPVTAQNQDASVIRVNNLAMPDAASHPEYWPVFENTLYKTHGIKSLTLSTTSYFVIECSEDLKTWVPITVSSKTVPIPEEYQFYRYWRMANTYYNSSVTSNVQYNTVTFEPTMELPTTTNIHLSEAPPSGSVITADYDAVCVGKDSNHVFDFSLTVQYGEYTEAQ